MNLPAAVRAWPPASFSFVMAAGITSTALDRAGAGAWSLPPLAVGLAGFAVLAVVALHRLVTDSGAVLRSLAAPPQAFGYFTLVAAAGVLALRTDAADLAVLPVVLALVALVAGAVLLYVVPAALVLRPGGREHDAGPDGGWLLWVVALQSLSLVTSGIDLGVPSAAAGISFSLWGAGVVLYLALVALVIGRLLTAPMSASLLLPSYWILTGATAISTLAAVRLQQVERTPDFIAVLHPAITGVAYVLWSFGTWWIPLLVVLGVWRYTTGHQPLRYELGLWSILFPLGMYSTASMALGSTTGVMAIEEVGRVGAVVTAVLWTLTILAMLGSVRRPASRPPDS